jgi:hypothetical protein
MIFSHWSTSRASVIDISNAHTNKRPSALAGFSLHLVKYDADIFPSIPRFEVWWNGEKVGHVTRCIYTLERGKSWIVAPFLQNALQHV